VSLCWGIDREGIEGRGMGRCWGWIAICARREMDNLVYEVGYTYICMTMGWCIRWHQKLALGRRNFSSEGAR